MDGVGASDGVGPGFGQAEVPDLPVADEVGEGTDGVLDRCAWVDPVLVVEVDVVGAEALKRALDSDTDVGRAAVASPGAATVVGDETELCGQDHLVAAASQGAADEFFVG